MAVVDDALDAPDPVPGRTLSPRTRAWIGLDRLLRARGAAGVLELTPAERAALEAQFFGGPHPPVGRRGHLTVIRGGRDQAS